MDDRIKDWLPVGLVKELSDVEIVDTKNNPITIEELTARYNHLLFMTTAWTTSPDISAAPPSR